MFICKKCLEKDFDNWGSMSKSYGKCEFCAMPELCFDIPSKYLIRKSEIKNETDNRNNAR